jgi:CheY-like chemotaxis protein
MHSKLKLLLVDDELGAHDSLQQRAFLRAYGGLPFEFCFETCEAAGSYNSEKVMESLRADPDTDLVLLDIKFGKEDALLGYEILPLLSARFPSVPVLVMSSMDRDIESLGRCLEDGAVGFVAKDLKPNAV